MAKAKPATKRAKVKGIHVEYFTLGSDSRSVPVKAGTTLGEFRVAKGLEGLDVKVNSSMNPNPSSVLADGDRVTVVPKAKGGIQ